MTAVSARSSGRPAATSAPNATSRMSSVIGSDSVSARLKSSSKAFDSALSADAPPNCSMRSSGCARCAAAVAASDGSTRSATCSSLPGILNVTTAERPSGEIWPSLPRRSGDWTSVTWGAALRLLVTSRTAAAKAGSPERIEPLP